MLLSSFALRLGFADFESGDYREWLRRWYDFFVAHGAWHGLGLLTDKVSNYPPLYMYLVSISSVLPLPAVWAIKLWSIAGDYLAAWYSWRLVRQLGRSHSQALAMAAVILFLPTVVMNSSIWAQCDILYATGLLASLYYLLADRPLAALVAFGFSCSLKPQAIFWCPMLAALLLVGRLPWKYIWVPGAIYVATCLPAIAAGRRASELLFHWGRIHYRPGITFHAPNWYQFVQWRTLDEYQFWSRAGITLTTVVTTLLVLWAWKMGREQLREPVPLITLAIASVLLSPFFLPKMHDRYFFAADLISILYAFTVPRGWVVAVLVQSASLICYWPFLFRHQLVTESYKFSAILNTIAVIWVIVDLIRLLRFRPGKIAYAGRPTGAIRNPTDSIPA